MPENLMTEPKRKLLGRILKEMKLVTEGQIQEALAIQKERGGAIGSILVSLNYITDQELLLALGAQSGMEAVDLDSMEIKPEVIERVSPSVATVYKVIPVRYENGVLTLALADPLNVKVLDDLRFLLDCEIKGAVSNPEAVDRALDKYYAGETDSVEDLLSELEDEEAVVDFDTSTSESITWKAWKNSAISHPSGNC